MESHVAAALELLLVIPAKAGLRRQDAGANIGEADGPKGEPQDAASNPVTLL
jgi:hypothetical protein